MPGLQRSRTPTSPLLTVTVTEAGYRRVPRRPERLAARRCAARRGLRDGAAVGHRVSCDNLPGNGQALRDAVLAVADPRASRRGSTTRLVRRHGGRSHHSRNDGADRAVARELIGLRRPRLRS